MAAIAGYESDAQLEVQLLLFVTSVLLTVGFMEPSCVLTFYLCSKPGKRPWRFAQPSLTVEKTELRFSTSPKSSELENDSEY